MSYNWTAVLVMILTTYAIRVIPLTLLRKPIKSRFIRSFLYYVPYVTLAAMTFPAIVQATEIPLAGALAMLTGVIIAWKTENLFLTAIVCSATVFAVDAVLFFLI